MVKHRRNKYKLTGTSEELGSLKDPVMMKYLIANQTETEIRNNKQRKPNYDS